MRIAFFTETFFPAADGVVTRLRYTLEELNRLGDETLVFAPKLPGLPETYAGARVRGVPGVPFPHYPQIKLSPPNPRVSRDLEEFQPDVVHVVNPVILGPSGVLWARRQRIPLVVSYHTNLAAYADFYGLGFLVGPARRATRYLYNKADVNLCTSSATMDYLRGEGIERLELWPQGVDARLFHPERASGEWRARLTGGHPEDGLALFVGRLAPEKGIQRLKAVVKGVPDIRLAIVGDGPHRKELEKEFAGTRTVFAGELHGEELAAAYASSDVFVFPSTTETLGMTMIEALASGVPVVAARTGAVPEVVADGESGLLYEPGSEEELASSVRRVLSDDALRHRMSRAARAAAGERTWEASTRTLRGYYELAQERKRGGFQEALVGA